MHKRKLNMMSMNERCIQAVIRVKLKGQKYCAIPNIVRSCKARLSFVRAIEHGEK